MNELIAFVFALALALTLVATKRNQTRRSVLTRGCYNEKNH